MEDEGFSIELISPLGEKEKPNRSLVRVKQLRLRPGSQIMYVYVHVIEKSAVNEMADNEMNELAQKAGHDKLVWRVPLIILLNHLNMG